MLESLGLLATISGLKYIRKKIVPTTSKDKLKKSKNEFFH